MPSGFIPNPAGLEELLISPTGAVAREVLRRGLLVESEATRLCPVDTGRLRGSITHQEGADAEGPYVDVGSNVEYAIYVELGTSKMSPQPYLRPALNAARSA